MEMNETKIKKNIVLSGEYEDIIEIKDHYYLINKKQRICVLPYTISTQGLLDKIGVIKDLNILTEEYDYTLINGYISEDDNTNLVTANRLLYEIIGSNIKDADLWMYLGTISSYLSSDSEIRLYCVNISEIGVKESKSVEDEKEAKRFQMIDCSKVVTSNDMIFLAGYLRLFNYFYVNSLS